MSFSAIDAPYCLEQLARYVCKERYIATIAAIKCGQTTIQDSGFAIGSDAIMAMLEGVRFEVKKAMVATNRRLAEEEKERERERERDRILEQEYREYMGLDGSDSEMMAFEDYITANDSADTCEVFGGILKNGKGLEHIWGVDAQESPDSHNGEAYKAEVVDGGGEKIPRSHTYHAFDRGEKHHADHGDMSREVTHKGHVIDRFKGDHRVATDRKLGGVLWSSDCCGSYGTPVCENTCCQGNLISEEYQQLTHGELLELRSLQFGEYVRQARVRAAHRDEFSDTSIVDKINLVNQLAHCPKQATNTVIEFPIEDATVDETEKWYRDYDTDLFDVAMVVNNGHFDPCPGDGSRSRLRFRATYCVIQPNLKYAIGTLRQYALPLWLHSSIVGIGVRVGEHHVVIPHELAIVPKAHPLGLHDAGWTDAPTRDGFVIREYRAKLPDGHVPKFRNARVGEFVVTPHVVGRYLAICASTEVVHVGVHGRYSGTPHANSIGAPVIAMTDGAVVGFHHTSSWSLYSSKFLMAGQLLSLGQH